MTAFFIHLCNMSISAGWLVPAVVLLRLCLRKAPRWILPVLWGIVGLRLVLPFTVESIFSLIPSAETIAPEIVYAAEPTIHSGVYALNSAVNPVIAESFAPAPGASVNPLQVWMAVGAAVWLIGFAGMLIYAFVSWLLLVRKMADAVRLEDNIWETDRSSSPFVLGIVRPKIYLPFGMPETVRSFVIAHEKAHICRKDHFIKPIGFFLLALHWFNPLIWLAYVLLCRDIELACDERVIRELDREERAGYSQALLVCSIPRRSIAACPVAFGEVSVKARVRSVLSYRKPAFWILTAALIVCAVTAVCFLTNPVTAGEEDTSLLYYKNAAPAVMYRPEVQVIHYPPAEENENTSIQFGGADGKDLAAFLENAQWTVCNTPSGKLHSPGSVQFVIEDDWRITVYDRRGLYAYASVEYGGETRYYHAPWGDYGKAVSFCRGERRKLTLDDVLRLKEEKGETLTWSDFEEFSCYETGSGLYIRVYEIDEMFSLAIGGSYPLDKAPMYIYLSANVREEARIDIRYEDPAAFIELYRSETAGIDCSWGWQCSPVGYSLNILTRMNMDAIASSAVESQVKTLPVLEIRSREELKAFMDSMADVMDFDRKTEDTPSFRETLELYDGTFFDHSVLFLLCIIAPDTACRYEMEYAWLEAGLLELGIARAEYSGGDTMMEGWLMAVGIPADQLETMREVSARVVASYDPEAGTPEVMDSYIACIPDPSDINSFMLSSVTLYEDGTYMFFFSPISSHIGHGTFVMTEDRLELYSGGEDTAAYTFAVADGELIFDAAASPGSLWYSDITDGTVFEKVYTLPEGTWIVTDSKGTVSVP